MWNRMLVGCVLVMSVGCEQGKPQADCDGAVAAVARAAAASGGNSQAPTAPLVARCREDKWSAEAATCIKGAATLEAQEKCRFDHLTQAQNAKFTEAAEPLLEDGNAEQAMQAMSRFMDKMCACNNAECAKKVSDEMTLWSQDMAKKSRKPPKMDEKTMKRAQDIGTRMGECMQKAMTTQ